MLFSSSVFLFQFLPLVLALYYIPFRDRRGAQNLLLLLASLFFYAWGGAQICAGHDRIYPV